MRLPIRGPLTFLVLLLGAVAVVWTVHRVFPVNQWLVWRALSALSTAAAWTLGCASTGWTVVRKLWPAFPWFERLVIALPIGILLYVWATFILGLCGGLGTISFFALPAAFLAIGARDMIAVLRRFKGRVAPLFKARFSVPWPVAIALCIGIVGLLLVYVPILTPDNLQYDTRWYHLPIAQQYASSGKVEPFYEGWFLGAYPHLSSMLYSWALLAPVGINGRLLLAAHMEFVLFLYTLACIPVMARSISGQKQRWWAWTAAFLFPGFLVYDSTLSLGADHIAAIWAPAGLLLAVRVMRSPDARRAAFLGAIAAGAALTKLSAICIVAPMWLALATIVVPRRRLRTWVFPGSAACLALACGIACFAALSSQHWLKNWITFGDPLYPTLHKYLPVHPWNPDAETYFSTFFNEHIPKPTANLDGLWKTLFATFAVGFGVNEFNFHGDYPTFGYLFPIAAVLVFLAPIRRARGTVILCLLGVAVWYVTGHRDRYLQAILPWLVATTFVAFTDAWQRHPLPVRVAVGGLLLTQVVVSLGIWLIPAHWGAKGKHPIVPLIDYVESGIRRKYTARDKPFSSIVDWAEVGRELPKGAKVLVHEDRYSLGLGAPIVTDESGWQAGIHYGSMSSTQMIYDSLRSLGVTHVVTGNTGGDWQHSMAGYLLFWDFLTNDAQLEKRVGYLSLYSMPTVPPTGRDNARVLVLFCNRPPAAGIYELSALQYSTLPARAPVQLVDLQDLPSGIWNSVEYAVREKNCADKIATPGRFRQVYTRDDRLFFVRKPTKQKSEGK